MIFSNKVTKSINTLYKLIGQYKANPTSTVNTQLSEASKSFDKMMSEEILSSTQSRRDLRAFALILADLESALDPYPNEKTAFLKLGKIVGFFKQHQVLEIVETIECYITFLSSTLSKKQARNCLSPASVAELKAVRAAESQAPVDLAKSGASVKRNHSRVDAQEVSSSRFFYPATDYRHETDDKHETDDRDDSFDEALYF